MQFFGVTPMDKDFDYQAWADGELARKVAETHSLSAEEAYRKSVELFCVLLDGIGFKRTLEAFRKCPCPLPLVPGTVTFNLRLDERYAKRILEANRREKEAVAAEEAADIAVCDLLTNLGFIKTVDAMDEVNTRVMNEKG